MAGTHEIISLDESNEKIEHAKGQTKDVAEVLTEVKGELHVKQKKIAHWEENIDSILSKKSNDLKQLEKIKSFCSEELSQQHLDEIKTNRFHQPLINSSLDEEKSKNLFLDIDKSLLSSDLLIGLSSLTTYLSTSGDFLNETTLVIDGRNLQNDRLNWRSRILQVSENEIMITGGTNTGNRVLLLNLLSQDLEDLINLTHYRNLHAMAWLDNKPAVIGGSGSNNEALNHVEVFTKEGWKESKPLNIKRYGLSACTLQNTVWVAGGAEDPKTGVSEIEVYKNNKWQIIEAKLPNHLMGIGMVNLGDKIILLGGMNSLKKNTSSVWEIDSVKTTLNELASLESPVSFSQNLWKISNNLLEGTAFKGKKVSYSLE